MKHFITGDRAVEPSGAIVPVLCIMLRIAVGDPGATFATGDNQGVETVVIGAGLLANVEVEVVTSPYGEDGKVDWDARHESLVQVDGLVFDFIHSDPLSSRIGKSLERIAGPRVTHQIGSFA